jgi:hypothetical protein
MPERSSARSTFARCTAGRADIDEAYDLFIRARDGVLKVVLHGTLQVGRQLQPAGVGARDEC